MCKCVTFVGLKASTSTVIHLPVMDISRLSDGYIIAAPALSCRAGTVIMVAVSW